MYFAIRTRKWVFTMKHLCHACWWCYIAEEGLAALQVGPFVVEWTYHQKPEWYYHHEDSRTIPRE